MDTIDRSRSNLPAQFSSQQLSPLPPLTPALSFEQPGVPSVTIGPKVILRGLTRYWKLIFVLWLLLSTPAVLLVLYTIKPTFEASSLLQIEPARNDIFAPIAGTRVDLKNMTYLQTQVQKIGSNRVLEAALHSPLVVNLPTVQKWPDPTYNLRQRLRVGVVGDTNLIRVTLELEDSNEAIAIVKAVVEQFRIQHAEFNREVNHRQTETYEGKLVEIGLEREKKRGELGELVTKGNFKFNAGELLNPKHDADSAQPTFKSLPEDHLQRMISETYATELELYDAQSLLDAKLAANQATQDANEEQRGHEMDEALVARIQDEFRKDPEVAALVDEIEKIRDHLDHNKRVVRQANDPSRQAAVNHLQNLSEKYDLMWRSKYDGIFRRLRTESGITHSLASIEELKLKIKMLTNHLERQKTLLTDLEFKQKGSNGDTFQGTYLHYQLNSLLEWEDQVRKNLEQLKYEAIHDAYVVNVIEEASAAKSASSSKAVKYMAAAPVGILFTMLGLFLLLEIRAERVADPDALSTRVRSEVYALPLLPNKSSVHKLSESVVVAQIEQFSQRLDHLRFAVCGNSAELGRGRCVMLTSAIGGEGKTTLASQLALRCGNAGVHTLLIDSDFRRSSLCELLEVVDGPGLSDLLKDETTFDQVVMPVYGGAFYLLPAGKFIEDPSRVLQGPKFGQLINQLRQLYDLIIIDSPPVLPVPDALIMGRWADGAILAARYDKSRFPQVERARRQLDNAGIPILGTVINGMRDTDSYYGRYKHSRRPTSEPESSNAV
jgi:succinoglycan biosynthesis transport protein ExoP